MFGSVSAHSQDATASAVASPNWYESLCQGKCAATILFGPQLITGLGNVDGTSSFKPPWNYQYGSSYFVGGALSRSFLELGKLAAFEIEGGAGQRFGSLHETEGWIALYARWKYFPWNDYIVTSGSPDGGRGADLAFFAGIWTHSSIGCS
jgi:hypothetical protein